jgi:tetratricopeptide (TPR) repeat protein
MRDVRRVHTRFSSDRAAAELLHDLDDDSALQRSPLLAGLSAEAQRYGADASEIANLLRDRVQRILAEAADGANDLISARAARVILRHDVAGENSASVMRDLAISRAEFYRQLSAGRRGLALAVQRLALPGRSPDLRLLDLRLRGASTLAQMGRLDDAVKFLAPMLAETSGIDAVRVACALGELHLEANRLPRARALVGVARGAAASLDGHIFDIGAAKIAVLECSIDLKDAWRGGDWLTRDFDTLLSRLQVTAQPDDALALDTISELIQLLATRAGYLGQFERAVALLESSPANDPAAPVAPTIRGEVLMRLASIRQLLPQSLDAALANARQLQHFASTHGLQRLVTAALASRAGIASLRGHIELARDFAREAFASSRAFFVPFDHAGVCTMAASVALDAARPDEALAFGREARRFAPAGSFPHLLSRVFDANALQLQGRSEAALRALEAVETGPAARPFSLISGRAAFVRSRVYRARGDYRRALRSARDSIDILHNTGHRHALLQALALANTLVPDQRLRRRFEELRATL